MSNLFQVKRTSVSGRTPNTTSSGNSSYISAGELAINLPDGKLFSSNGTALFEIGANLTNISVTGGVTTANINITSVFKLNGSVGTNNQVLTSNGTTAVWQSFPAVRIYDTANTLLTNAYAVVATSINDLSDVDTVTAAPANGQVLTWSNSVSNWVPANSSGGGGIPSGNVTFSGSLLPDANVSYDLGSDTMRWRTIYLSGNTITLGGGSIKTDATTGTIALIPPATGACTNPTAVVISTTGGITTAATTGGTISSNALSNAASSAAPAMTTGKAIAMSMIFGG